MYLNTHINQYLCFVCIILISQIITHEACSSNMKGSMRKIKDQPQVVSVMSVG